MGAKKSQAFFFFDIKKSPYLYAINNDELIKIIESHTEKDYKDNCKKVIEFYGCYESGIAAKETCKIIVDFLNKK